MGLLILKIKFKFIIYFIYVFLEEKKRKLILAKKIFLLNMAKMHESSSKKSTAKAEPQPRSSGTVRKVKKSKSTREVKMRELDKYQNLLTQQQTLNDDVTSLSKLRDSLIQQLKEKVSQSKYVPSEAHTYLQNTCATNSTNSPLFMHSIDSPCSSRTSSTSTETNSLGYTSDEGGDFAWSSSWSNANTPLSNSSSSSWDDETFQQILENLEFTNDSSDIFDNLDQIEIQHLESELRSTAFLPANNCHCQIVYAGESSVVPTFNAENIYSPLYQMNNVLPCSYSL